MKLFDRKTITGSSLAILAVLLIALLALTNVLFRGWRLDLTENRQYTIAKGTREIAVSPDEPINLYFYYSDNATRDIHVLRNYAQRVREMIEEVVSHSKGKLKLSVIDPQPFSEDEDRATNFGLQAVPIGANGENVFFGLAATNATGAQAIIPFFQPDKEVFLEYDIAKLVQSLATEKKPKIGMISGLEMGPSFDPNTRSMKQGWVIQQLLAERFDVQQMNANALTTIDPEVSSLVVVHPKALSEEAQYAIDQFVMRGGKLIAFVDPFAELDRSGDSPEANPMDFANRASDLPALFSAWGIEYDASKVLLDADHALAIQPDPTQPPVRHLAILGFTTKDLNDKDIVSAQLETLNFASSGAFGLKEGSGLKLQPLVQSGTQSMLTDSARMMLAQDPNALFDGFTPGNQTRVLAGRLVGKLNTAFPQRAGEGHLTQTKSDAQIILVADTDVLSDRLWVQVGNWMGQQTLQAFANNGDFTVNAVDNLSGSDALISVRGRATSQRPFTRVDDLKRNADERFRAKEAELQQQLEDTESRLNELQAAKGGQGDLMLSKEQQAELEKFQQDKLRIRKELRGVRHQLDANIESLGTRLKLINILLMPILVTLAALYFHWRRRQQRARELQGGAA